MSIATISDVRNRAPEGAGLAEAPLSRLCSALAAVRGDAFVQQYALEAARALGVDYFVISRLNPFSNIMRSLAFVADGKPQDNISYSLDGTPCARAIEDSICIYADDVAACFPQDRFLTDCGISGYAGIPLRDSENNVLGVSLAMTRAPIIEPEEIRKVLECFAPRTAAAIEETETLERYSWAIAEATDGVWDWDVVTGGTVVSPAIRGMLDCCEGSQPCDLARIVEAIHPDDRSTHDQALRDHLNNGAPFDVMIRLKDRNGVYRQHRSRGKAMRDADGRPVRMIGSFTDIQDIVLASNRDKVQA